MLRVDVTNIASTNLLPWLKIYETFLPQKMAKIGVCNFRCMFHVDEIKENYCSNNIAALKLLDLKTVRSFLSYICILASHFFLNNKHYRY